MVALFFDVEVLSYRGNARDNERKTPCPITIQGLVTLHNAVVKFKLDTKAEVNLSQYIEANAKLKAEWVGWSEYQRKHGYRLTQIQAYPRLKPAKDGDGDISINPPLSKGKGENLGKVNCALAPINSISFADRHAAANKEYGRTNLSKPTAEQVVNFHSLLFMEIQYLGGCDILWKDSGPLKSGATGGPGGSKNGAPSLSIIASHDTSLDSTEKDNAVLLLKVLAQSADGASTADGASASQVTAAAAVSAAPAAAAAAVSDVAASDASAASASASAAAPDLCDITKWDHRSGEFPLTDSALEQMVFSYSDRPKYYWAAGLLLFMRPSRTEKEEEVFKDLSSMWQNWFAADLDYAYLAKGPPNKGRDTYSEAERNWCDVRMKVLDASIKDTSDRERLGLKLKSSSRGKRNEKSARLNKERQDLGLDADVAAGPSPPGRTAGAARDNDRREASRVGTGAGDKHAEPTGRVKRMASIKTGARAQAGDKCAHMDSSEDEHEDSSSAKKTEKTEKRGAKRRREHRDGDGDTIESDDVENKLPRRGKLSKNGKIVSSKDGRPLVANVALREKYKSSYRDAENTRLWQGYALDLGQAFKLAVWTRHGSNMPVEKNGNLETRTALFRTAAYYALSMDGSDEDEIMESPQFADFLFILVQVTKQMRYQILSEGRVFFGDKVFTSELRASKLFQRE